MMDIQKVATDVLVIGGGGAGTRAALAAQEKGVDVTLVCKGLITRSGSTPLASWGFAASFGHNDPADSPRQHFLDTLREGRNLSDQDLVEILVQKAPECALDLEQYGLKIKKQNDGRYEQIRVPGETYPRSLIIEGGGRRIMQVLRKKLLQQKVRTWEDTFIIDLLKRENEVIGAWGINLREGIFVVFEAASVIIATGGCGSLWGLNDNPSENIGDGFYLAYHAGASLVDLELMLYYPMVIISPSNARGTLLDYEICLEPNFCDGKLLNGQGEEFMATSPLPARDELMKAIVREVQEGRGTPNGGVFVDLRCSGKPAAEVEQYAKTLLGAYNYLKEMGVDLVRNKVEIAPAAHYTLGGIHIDGQCRTTVSGLFAAGEVTGNIHGANRISGNALAETQVFGKIAGESAAEYARQRTKIKVDEQQISSAWRKIAHRCEPEEAVKADVTKEKGVTPGEIKKRTQQIMDQYVGYGRSEKGLNTALKELQLLKEEGLPRLCAKSGRVFNLALLDALESMVMLEVAQMVCTGALARKETRGHHYRTDYPAMDAPSALHMEISQSQGKIVVQKLPVRTL